MWSGKFERGTGDLSSLYPLPRKGGSIEQRAGEKRRRYHEILPHQRFRVRWKKRFEIGRRKNPEEGISSTVCLPTRQLNPPKKKTKKIRSHPGPNLRREPEKSLRRKNKSANLRKKKKTADIYIRKKRPNKRKLGDGKGSAQTDLRRHHGNSP